MTSPWDRWSARWDTKDTVDHARKEEGLGSWTPCMILTITDGKTRRHRIEEDGTDHEAPSLLDNVSLLESLRYYNIKTGTKRPRTNRDASITIPAIQDQIHNATRKLSIPKWMGTTTISPPPPRKLSTPRACEGIPYHSSASTMLP